jgi:large exoprotein involved in heme utilization and adhesion
MGQTSLGDGSQILGGITVQNCLLAGGGSYKTSDPDERGAVMKGFGLARNLTLQTGQVINGSGDFGTASIEWQRAYHPKQQATS